MANPDVIVVAVDFEPGSERALELGKELAAKLGCELVLVHVYQLPIYTYPGLEPTALPGLQTEITGAAQRALDQLATKHGVQRAILREGDPSAEIVATIEELHPKLTVLGTHGRRGLTHLFLGSVAERVVRRSVLPVVTVRSEAR